MNNNPRITIVTITYNSERTLEETIKSVISQDYNNLEYIIIDGGSKDKTLKIVEKYKNQIDLVVSEPDEGISDAFNKGIYNATGEIIGIINSDDLLLPNALHALSKVYEKDVDVYRGNTIGWDDNSGTKIKGVPSMSFPVYSLKRKSICHQSTFVSKKAYEKYGGYDINLKYMMDADLLMRMYRNKAIMKYVDADLAVSRIGGVTDQTLFWAKRKEVVALVLNNGGNICFAYVKLLYFLIYQSIKNVLFVMGPDRMRRIRYRKSLQN